MLLFASCRHGSEGKINYNFETIDVDFSDTQKALSTDIIDSIEYIKLADTKDPIGNVKKIIVADGKIMLLDNSRKSIWIFTTDGKFVNRISAPGQGPEEYTSKSLSSELLLQHPWPRQQELRIL